MFGTVKIKFFLEIVDFCKPLRSLRSLLDSVIRHYGYSSQNTYHYNYNQQLNNRKTRKSIIPKLDFPFKVVFDTQCLLLHTPKLLFLYLVLSINL